MTKFISTSTDNDMPNLETHDEIRYCQYCQKDTPHRVGVHEQYVDRPKYTAHLAHEYAHCECGNTATITLRQDIVKKGIA